jgi:hypothetical protein
MHASSRASGFLSSSSRHHHIQDHDWIVLALAARKTYIPYAPGPDSDTPAIMIRLMTTAFTTALFSLPALGNLYVTRPVANTIYETGLQASLIWMDDGTAPLLADMPKLQLDLYSPDNVRTRGSSCDAIC